jgi:hypothetical protein
MLTIAEYSVELIKDPFGILTGKRYEFIMDLEVAEDDELYSESGLFIRTLFLVEESQSRIIKYEIFEKNTEKYLDFDLEDDEIDVVAAFCNDHYIEAN